MKVGIITFHASYNFGSMLQAYALQTYLNKFKNIECKIINFRSTAQKNLYKYPWERYEILPVYFIKLLLLHSRKEKNRLFEEFLNQEMHLTKEYNDASQLSETNLNFDFFICGSDQIWNFRAPDYNEAYFLPLISGEKKISYAASFGGRLNFTDKKKELDLAIRYLKDFMYVSVRENSAVELLQKAYGGGRC